MALVLYQTKHRVYYLKSIFLQALGAYSGDIWSLQIWSAFLMCWGKQIVTSIDFLKENISNYDTFKM